MSARGDRRRDGLEKAGVELLAEGGWRAVTARAVAARAGANPGLIHYHYGGLPQLHRAVATRAVEASIRPMVEQVVAADDVWRGVLDVIAGVGEGAQDGTERLTSELVVGALRDDVTRDLVRDELRRARADLTAWAARVEPSWTAAQAEGVAVLVTALLDGLFLQHLVDESLDVTTAADGLAVALGRHPRRPNRSRQTSRRAP